MIDNTLSGFLVLFGLLVAALWLLWLALRFLHWLLRVLAGIERPVAPHSAPPRKRPHRQPGIEIGLTTKEPAPGVMAKRRDASSADTARDPLQPAEVRGFRFGIGQNDIL